MAKSAQQNNVRAVVDRIVDDLHAVLLIGPQEIERVVPRSTLPPDAVEGTWLLVQFQDEQLVAAVVDETAVDAARQRIDVKAQLLRRRGSRLKPVDD